MRTRQQVEASEAKLKLLSNTVPSMIFYLDPQQRNLSYNKTFMDWFGVDATQVIGQTVRDMLGERAYDQVAPHLAVAYGDQPERYELLAPSRLGGERWLDITYTPHRDEAGQLPGVIVLAHDISPQVQARQALEESKNSLQNAIQIGDLGTFSVDIATGLLTCSARRMVWLRYPDGPLPKRSSGAWAKPSGTTCGITCSAPSWRVLRAATIGPTRL
jgi:PAS domain S-box-containing protein